MELTAAAISGFVLAVFAPLAYRLTGKGAAWLLAAAVVVLLAYFGSHVGNLPDGGVAASYTWAPSLGVRFSLRLDGLSLLFALLITGVGALVLVYTGGYSSGDQRQGRLLALLLAFMASMLGLVLADNILTLFVFWELTSLSSYLLIGFDHQRAEARGAALRALLVTSGAGLALLAGLVLLASAGEQLGLPSESRYELASLLTLEGRLADHAHYLPILILVAVGALAKSAQFPFHFWLPTAMEAPTPVSAYLHSATMVKAGVYLLARLSPILGGTEAWLWIVGGIGCVTMVMGAVLAVRQSDIKRLLAYSTMSALGMLFMLLGIGSTTAVEAALAFLLAHALYKAGLFLVAGLVDHATGSRDLDRLGGLAKAMPFTTLAAVLAALSMAAVPPLFGFVAKELVLEASLHSGPWLLLTGATTLTGALFVALAILVGVRPFVGHLPQDLAPQHRGPMSMWLGPVVLGGAGLALGIQPWLVDRPLLAPAVNGVLVHDGPAELDLALWHGWKPAVGLSLASYAVGLALYWFRDWLRAWPRLSASWGPAGLFDATLRKLSRPPKQEERLIASGYLRYYLLTTFMTFALLVGVTLALRSEWQPSWDWSGINYLEVGIVVLIPLAILATLFAPSRLAAIAAVSVVGYAMALLFIIYGAPDLAMAQFLVETLTVILFVLVFYHLPAGADEARQRVRARDGLVAVTVGGVMSMLVLLAVQVEYFPKISHYFTEHSVPLAHGRNVVNVILVDFRALDTLGEITVIAGAGLGVYALLKLRAREASE